MKQFLALSLLVTFSVASTATDFSQELETETTVEISPTAIIEKLMTSELRTSGQVERFISLVRNLKSTITNVQDQAVVESALVDIIETSRNQNEVRLAQVILGELTKTNLSDPNEAPKNPPVEPERRVDPTTPQEQPSKPETRPWPRPDQPSPFRPGPRRFEHPIPPSDLSASAGTIPREPLPPRDPSFDPSKVNPTTPHSPPPGFPPLPKRGPNLPETRPGPFGPHKNPHYLPQDAHGPDEVTPDFDNPDRRETEISPFTEPTRREGGPDEVGPELFNYPNRPAREQQPERKVDEPRREERRETEPYYPTRPGQPYPHMPPLPNMEASLINRLIQNGLVSPRTVRGMDLRLHR